MQAKSVLCSMYCISLYCLLLNQSIIKAHIKVVKSKLTKHFSATPATSSYRETTSNSIEGLEFQNQYVLFGS